MEILGRTVTKDALLETFTEIHSSWSHHLWFLSSTEMYYACNTLYSLYIQIYPDKSPEEEAFVNLDWTLNHRFHDGKEDRRSRLSRFTVWTSCCELCVRIPGSFRKGLGICQFLTSQRPNVRRSQWGGLTNSLNRITISSEALPFGCFWSECTLPYPTGAVDSVRQSLFA